jgi:hypothetical protein
MKKIFFPILSVIVGIFLFIVTNACQQEQPPAPAPYTPPPAPYTPPVKSSSDISIDTWKTLRGHEDENKEKYVIENWILKFSYTKDAFSTRSDGSPAQLKAWHCYLGGDISYPVMFLLSDTRSPSGMDLGLSENGKRGDEQTVNVLMNLKKDDCIVLERGIFFNVGSDGELTVIPKIVRKAEYGTCEKYKN